jgi:hypothetical protein
MIGWFVGFLLWPLKLLWPRSAVAVGHIGAFGLAISLFASLALLIDHSHTVDTNSTTNTI